MDPDSMPDRPQTELRAKFGRNRVNSGQIWTTTVQCWLNLADYGSTLPEMGPSRSKCGRICKIDKVWPIPVKFGRDRPRSGHIWPSCSKRWPASARSSALGSLRPDLALLWDSSPGRGGAAMSAGVRLCTRRPCQRDCSGPCHLVDRSTGQVRQDAALPVLVGHGPVSSEHGRRERKGPPRGRGGVLGWWGRGGEVELRVCRCQHTDVALPPTRPAPDRGLHVAQIQRKATDGPMFERSWAEFGFKIGSASALGLMSPHVAT